MIVLFTLSFLFSGCNKDIELKKKEEAGQHENTPSEEVKDTLKNTTKLQEFLSKKGTIIVKDYYALGNLSGSLSTKMKFDALVFYEPGKEENRNRGIKIEITESTPYSAKTGVAYLDLEELESLSNALEYMSKLRVTWESSNKEYTEVFYISKSNFQTGFFKKADSLYSFAKAGDITSAICIIKSTDDLLDIKNKIDDGIKLLNLK